MGRKGREGVSKREEMREQGKKGKEREKGKDGKG